VKRQPERYGGTNLERQKKTPLIYSLREKRENWGKGEKGIISPDARKEETRGKWEALSSTKSASDRGGE